MLGFTPSIALGVFGGLWSMAPGVFAVGSDVSVRLGPRMIDRGALWESRWNEVALPLRETEFRDIEAAAVDPIQETLLAVLERTAEGNTSMLTASNFLGRHCLTNRDDGACHAQVLLLLATRSRLAALFGYTSVLPHCLEEPSTECIVLYRWIRDGSGANERSLQPDQGWEFIRARFADHALEPGVRSASLRMILRASNMEPQR
jgi:hypothetical protein